MLAVVVTMSVCTHCELALAGLRSVAIGPASAAMMMVSGTRMRMVQVISAEEIWLTVAFSAGSVADRSAERASTGTIALLSAPPSTSSWTRLGTWFAVTYAVPRHV